MPRVRYGNHNPFPAGAQSFDRRRSPPRGVRRVRFREGTVAQLLIDGYGTPPLIDFLLDNSPARRSRSPFRSEYGYNGRGTVAGVSRVCDYCYGSPVID